jgi:hypothetical protein
MPEEEHDRPRLPPRWFMRLVWVTHRGLYRITPGRIGLWRPKAPDGGACGLPRRGAGPASRAA